MQKKKDFFRLKKTLTSQYYRLKSSINIRVVQSQMHFYTIFTGYFSGFNIWMKMSVVHEN